ncbi:MAG: toprim domain-containing protein [Nocardioides sp.]
MRPITTSELKALEGAVSRYEAAVSRDPLAVAYLLGRGLGREEAATHRLGVVAEPEPGHGRYRGMIVLPYLDGNRQPLTMRFRCIEDHDHRSHFHGKYNSMPNDPTRVFNIGAIFRADREIHVTEGEFDAIVLNKLGLPAVAIPGAKAWRPHHRDMLAGFSRVFVWADPDDAGAEFATKVASSMRTAIRVQLRDGDVTETFLAGGENAIRSLIKKEVAA